MAIVDKINSLTEKQCVVDVLLEEVLSHPCRSCGKCVYGYEGITQFEMILKDLTEKKAHSDDRELLSDIAGLMKTQSLCDEGKDIADAMIEALSSHKEEIDEHIAKKQCRAGVCKKFMTVHILASKCNGCGDCLDACEDDAILGKARFVHVIDSDECSLCGQCIEVCEEGAIVLAGAVKPKCPKKPIPCKKK